MRPGARLGCRAASGSWHIAAALTEDIGEEAEKTSFFSGDTNESLRELEPLTRTRTSTRSRQHATLLGLRRPEALIQRLPRMPAQFETSENEGAAYSNHRHMLHRKQSNRCTEDLMASKVQGDSHKGLQQRMTGVYRRPLRAVCE